MNHSGKLFPVQDASTKQCGPDEEYHGRMYLSLGDTEHVGAGSLRRLPDIRVKSYICTANWHPQDRSLPVT